MSIILNLKLVVWWIINIKNLLQFNFQFQNASYKPSVYVESEGSHRPSGRVLQRARLTLALRSLTGQNNIDVCIDYLGVTFKSHDYEELVTELFQINPNHFNLKEGARYGYAATLKCGEIDVLLSPYQDVNADGYDPSEDSGTMIELKGQGCRYVESYLRQQDRTWYDFLETCIALDGHFTRVDLAINDRNGLLDMPTLIEKCDRD